MRRVRESEIDNDFEREFCWGDDERHYYNPNRRKASVLGHHLRISEVLNLVKRFAPGPRVADLACAQGIFGLLLAEQGFDVTAVDIKPEFLKYAMKKYERGKYRTELGNLMEYRSSEPYDCVLAGEIIEHVAHPEKLLQSCRANLKPGGVLVLTTPNGNEFGSKLPTFKQVTDVTALIPRQFHWGDHLFLYTVDELRELFDRNGFDVVYAEKYHSSYVSQLKGVRYLMPLKALLWLERRTRHLTKGGKDSANLLILVGRRRADA
jgi:2-polyprenyl-6-hydroxyphenyl methylase/3-demethylubiquinone-9 3-methyltransferase